MGKLFFEPVFESGELKGGVTSMFMCGVHQFMFEFHDKLCVPRIWRKEIEGIVEMMSVEPVYDCSGRKVDIDEDKVMYANIHNIDSENIYVYKKSPKADGGFVVASTSEMDGLGKPSIERQENYPAPVFNGGNTERFFYDYYKFFGEVYPAPYATETPMWSIGRDLFVDEAILECYFDDIKWDELYWKLVHSVGRQWKQEEMLEACAYVKNPDGTNALYEKLIAKTEAQKLLFWAIGNEYRLSDLYEIAETSHIIERYILLKDMK